MEQSTVSFKNGSVRVIACNTVVVGSGAAGLNAACRLHAEGQRDIALITEGMRAGTSRNTGSDKQTYYKLTLSGGDQDSVRDMARNLFEGQCVDGDTALCEAALSAQCFLRLAELGVPFPRSRYGEYVGYKTDHDPRRRAASAGPYTSRMMTEALERDFHRRQIKLYDNMQVIRILARGEELRGLLCLRLDSEEEDSRFTAFHCRNVVYATGGPAGMYGDSVFPYGHYGATGTALAAGVMGRNLTEWQYGLASLKPRWNVSGSYMQVLPRFVSTGADGSDEREFLPDFFGENTGEMLTKVFLKGYQWPFDVRKVSGGSSIIDILVYMERCKGRRVYLDFRENPAGGVDYSTLAPEAQEYLARAGADFGKPIDRLRHMNLPACSFYQDKGVDLSAEMLEISLCAQHNNGGLAVDHWWQTNLRGFFAAGEACASHGVYRPGGSALNAGQVGSTRAAQYIAANRKGAPEQAEAFAVLAAQAAGEEAALLAGVLDEGKENVQQFWDAAAARMSRIGAAVRSSGEIDGAVLLVQRQLEEFHRTVKAGKQHLHKVFRLRDMLLSQFVYLSAMSDYMKQGGKSRGSALYTDPAGNKPYDSLPDIFTFSLDDDSRGDMVQEVRFHPDEGCVFQWRKVRPIPEDDDFFENVWRSFRENGNIY